VFVSSDGGATWSDRSDPRMQYWSKDLIVDAHDPTQQTWYVATASAWGTGNKGPGGLFETTDRGLTWTRILGQSAESCTISPTDPNEMYVTTLNGLWYCSNLQAAKPTFTQVANYPFSRPERVFYNA